MVHFIRGFSLAQSTGKAVATGVISLVVVIIVEVILRLLARRKAAHSLTTTDDAGMSSTWIPLVNSGQTREGC